ncbi:MAG: hypothetical protein F4W91_16165 [Gemmatimonadetes bacterium]|nr:hypothetical protein [Gemmatimonadota bacterium]
MDTSQTVSHFAFFEESTGVWKVEYRDIQGVPLFQLPQKFASPAGCRRAIRIIKEAPIMEMEGGVKMPPTWIDDMRDQENEFDTALKEVTRQIDRSENSETLQHIEKCLSNLNTRLRLLSQTVILIQSDRK